MDTDMRDVEIVEDDMGEGVREIINELENYNDMLQRREWKRQEILRSKGFIK